MKISRNRSSSSAPDGTSVSMTSRLLELAGLDLAPPHDVEGPVARGGGQPRARTARHAVERPALQGPYKGVLHALLGEVPVAGEPDQGRQHPAPLVLEGSRDRRLDPQRIVHTYLPARLHVDREAAEIDSQWINHARTSDSPVQSPSCPSVRTEPRAAQVESIDPPLGPVVTAVRVTDELTKKSSPALVSAARQS